MESRTESTSGESTESTPESIFRDFEKVCGDSLNAYSEACRLYNESPPRISIAMRDMLVEHILLNLFVKWEFFLENLCIAYMLGAPDMSGTRPKRYVLPRDRAHALQLIQNGKLFPDWTNIDTVANYSDMFFEGDGLFKVLKGMNPITEIKTIRNAIAHASGMAAAKFSSLVRGKNMPMSDEMTPARFLCENRPHRTQTYCEYYIEYLRDAAGMLAGKPAPE